MRIANAHARKQLKKERSHGHRRFCQDTSHDDQRRFTCVDAVDAHTDGNCSSRYTFENFFHPFVGELIEQLNTKSLAGLLDADVHEKWTIARLLRAASTTL